MRQFIGYFLGFTIFIIGLPTLMWLCSDLIVPTFWQWVVGGMLAVAGLALAIWSVVYMKIHGKSNPFDAMGHEIAPRTQCLMTNGPYHYSRNPMLSGTLVYYLGIITILFSWQAVLIFVVVLFIMMVQVHNEEQVLSVISVMSIETTNIKWGNFSQSYDLLITGLLSRHASLCRKSIFLEKGRHYCIVSC